MRSIKAQARYAGVLYLLMSALAVFGFMYVPGAFIVPGDAAATARKIAEGALVYRAGILSALVCQVLFIFVVLALYDLFRNVDRSQARLLVALVCVGVAIQVGNLATRAAPLILQSADFPSAFPGNQMDTLALGFIRLGDALDQLITMFWGLWLFPFGLLAIKSGFFPRILGVLLFAAGAAYVVTSVTGIVFPDQLRTVSRIMYPLYFGELAMVLWLPIMGAKEPPRAPAS